MITLITGAPGSGKSAALVSLLLELSKDRAIFAHGIPDLKIQHAPLDDPTKWPEVVPDGSLVVIDEVQTIWRPKGPGAAVPPDIQALETHRHRGLDFYIITQSPRLVHTNVRALVGRHIHIRDVGFLGRWWYEWPECSESCTSAYRSAPIKKRYKLPKAAFDQYRSATVHIKPVRSFPAMVFVAAFALIGTAGAAYYAVSNIGKIGPSGPLASGSKAPAPSAAPAPVSPPPPNRIQAALDAAAASPPPPSPPPHTGTYDPLQFVPPDPHVPASAPAFDHLRVVVDMPRVVGGVCGPSACSCYTQRGTPVPMPEGQCRAIVDQIPFDPYTPPATATPGDAPPQVHPPVTSPPPSRLAGLF